MDLRKVLPALAAAMLLCGAAQAQDRTANPHGDLPAGLDCSACHTPEGWRTVKARLAFDHAKVSGFALTGMHAAAKCDGCHLDLRFDAPHVTQDACASCHADVHQGRIAGPCARCHDTRTFHDVPAIALHARAGFPLNGAHLDAPCESCHRNDRAGAFAAVPQECISCHRVDYAAALMPNHAAAGFPTDCQECHATVTWKGGVAFDHARAANGFVLEGAHATLSCESCHIPPNMALRFAASGQNDCVGCHRPQFDQAHGAGSGFPTTCASCHNVNTWSGASFDHALVANGFALLGAHTSLACTACHVEPGNALKFTPAPAGQTDCYACHQAQFNQAHGAGSGFPTTCASCHNVNSWSGASFDHSQFFPLTGPHAVSCASCHTTQGDYTQFTCLMCHGQSATAQQHQGVSGYTYDSHACYTCHRNGGGGGD